jgi:glucose/arabinose dehydrogenase
VSGDRTSPIPTAVDRPHRHPPAVPNHNGGDLSFGPDGYLYISAGSAGFNSFNGQERLSLLGKISTLT